MKKNYFSTPVDTLKILVKMRVLILRVVSFLGAGGLLQVYCGMEERREEERRRRRRQAWS